MIPGSTQFKVAVLGIIAAVILGLGAYAYVLKGHVKVLDLKLDAANQTITMQLAQIAQDKKAIAAATNNYNAAVAALNQERENKLAADAIYNPDCSKCPTIPSGKEITQDDLQAFKEFKNINWSKAIEINNNLVDQFNAVMLGNEAAPAAGH